MAVLEKLSSFTIDTKKLESYKHTEVNRREIPDPLSHIESTRFDDYYVAGDGQIYCASHDDVVGPATWYLLTKKPEINNMSREQNVLDQVITAIKRRKEFILNSDQRGYEKSMIADELDKLLDFLWFLREETE